MTEYKAGDKLAIRTSRLDVGHDYEYVSKTLIRHNDGRSYLGHLVRYPNTDDFIAYTSNQFNSLLKPWLPPYPFKLGDRIKLKEADLSDNCPVYTVMKIEDDGRVKLAFISTLGNVTQAHSTVEYADTWELVNDGDR